MVNSILFYMIGLATGTAGTITAFYIKKIITNCIQRQNNIPNQSSQRIQLVQPVQEFFTGEGRRLGSE
jgi:hypothetical protein